ncbi:MAG: hypothetical protein ABSG68_00445 [Thermoguttaceae bacterium]
MTQRADPESLAVLATVYAEASRYAEAARTGRQSLDAAGKTGNERFIQAMEPVVQSYERKGRCRFTASPCPVADGTRRVPATMVPRPIELPAAARCSDS